MTIFVFPGQGSQYVGMGKDFYKNYKIAKNIINEIEDYTSISIKKIIFEDPLDQIHLTQFTQICIFATSLSIFKVIEDNFNLDDNKKVIMLGHSLGEYTSLAASKKISIKDASILLKIRGKLMHNAIDSNTSGMAALIGSDCTEIERIIKENNLNLYVANDNSPQQVVISGMLENINNSKEIFLKNGIKKFVLLNVSAAFHSPIMLEAQKNLQPIIDETNFLENEISIISNFNAQISNVNSNIKTSLINQMANRVRWVESIKALEKHSNSKIIEIGPGKVLSGLIKRISSNFSINSINSIEDLNLSV